MHKALQTLTQDRGIIVLNLVLLVSDRGTLRLVWFMVHYCLKQSHNFFKRKVGNSHSHLSLVSDLNSKIPGL